MARVEYKPKGRVAFSVRLWTSKGHVIGVDGELDNLGEPVVSGDQGLTWNPLLIAKLVSYGFHEAKSRHSANPEKKKSHERAASEARKFAEYVSELCDLKPEGQREAWCSFCLGKTTHVGRLGGLTTRGIYLCGGCGAPTSVCAVPRCVHMASCGRQTVATPTFCAEHRHEVPGFERLTEPLSSLLDYKSWLSFDAIHAKRVVKLVVGVAGFAATIGPLAFLKAGQIGGAVGVRLAPHVLGRPLAGAAARNFGLALMGGGPLAAGGFGMAGGALMVAGAGAGLGGVVGGAATSKFVSDDKSFEIIKLRDGSGPAVVIASGLFSKEHDAWENWRRLIDDRYPDSPVYRVRWGAEERKRLYKGLFFGGVKAAAAHGAGEAARRAAKDAAFGPFAAVLSAPKILANVWSVAKSRSEKTGHVVADLISRIDAEQFILCGHSLGARVMVHAALELGAAGGEPRIHTMHLLGGAVGCDHDWRPLNDAVSSRVYNYYSARDQVLAKLYKLANLGQSPIGLVGFKSKYPKIRNRKVTNQVDGHSAYFTSTFRLAGDGEPKD